LAKTVAIPKELLRELVLELSRVEEALATIEELLDGEGLRGIRGLRRSTGKGATSLLRAARNWKSRPSE
jgi:hypothetical protein